MCKNAGTQQYFQLYRRYSAVTYGIVNGQELPIEQFKTYYLTDLFEYTLVQKRH